MDNNNFTLIREISESFKNFEKEKDNSYIEYACECFLNLQLPLEENECSELKDVFKDCPDDYLKLMASKDVEFLKNQSSEMDLDYIFEWHIFMKSEYFLNNEEQFKTYISYIIKMFPTDYIDDSIPLLFLRYIQDKLFFGGREAFNIASEITAKYNSWLANSILADLYFLEQNYENAIIFINKSNIWLKEDIEYYISESATNPAFKHFADDLLCSLSTNIITEIESYYFGNDCNNCIEKCDSILVSESTDLIAILEYECYFFKAFSLCELRAYKDALLNIDKALNIDNKDSLNNRNEEAIRLKLFLLEKLGKYNEKIDFINKLAEIDINLYINYSFQLDRLKKKEAISSTDEDEEKRLLIRPAIDKKISKRLLGDISYSGNEFTSEKLMEAFITSYIDRNLSVFGKQFSIFKNEKAFGRQYRIPNGVIDLLLVEKSTNALYIIELKKDKGYNNPIEQMKIYQKYVKEKIALKNQNVYGIICLSECEESLKSLIKKEDGIEVFSYDFSFRKEA